MPTDLTTLADAINAEHRACETALKTSLAHAIKAGELLSQAKALCSHGAWRFWLRDNFKGSERLAQSYMQVARNMPALTEGNPQRVADFSFHQALAALAAPKPPGDGGTLSPEEYAATVQQAGGEALQDSQGATPEMKRAAFQHLAADADVLSDAATFGSPTHQAIAEFNRQRDLASKREQQHAYEQAKKTDPIVRQLDETGAALDIEGICLKFERDCDRFAREISEVLPRVGGTGEEHLYWVRYTLSLIHI